MSYYNQPDHELLDRRNVQAQGFLLRLARAITRLDTTPASRTTPNTEIGVSAASDPALATWLALARARDLPPPDPEPLVFAPAADYGESRLPLVWRDHYVAAVLDGETPQFIDRLADLGFEVISFPASHSADPAAEWADPFRRLATALGRNT